MEHTNAMSCQQHYWMEECPYDRVNILKMPTTVLEGAVLSARRRGAPFITAELELALRRLAESCQS